MTGIDPVEEVLTLDANAADIVKTPIQREWESGKAVMCFGNRRFFDKTRAKALDTMCSPQTA